MGEIAKSSLCFSFAEARSADGGCHELNTRYVTLFAVREGHISVEVDGVAYALSTNQCGLYFGRESIRALYPAGVSVDAGWCAAQFLGSPFIVDGEAIPAASNIAISQKIDTLLRLGVELGANESASINRLRNAIGEAIFSAYLVDSAFGPEKNIPNIVLRAREYADRHFSESCDLNQLANAVGVTPEYLISAFRKHLGVTPGRYLWELRTRKAIHLVQQTALGLADIADQCGYKSQFHLSREIKRMTGTSPRALRYRRGSAM